jgi:hypothetical protein
MRTSAHGRAVLHMALSAGARQGFIGAVRGCEDDHYLMLSSNRFASAEAGSRASARSSSTRAAWEFLLAM